MGFVQESPLRVTRRTRLVGYAALVLAVVVGVVLFRASRPNLDPDTTSRTAAGVTVLVYTEDFEGALADPSHTSRLAVLDGGCLGLADGSLLVFPNKSKVLTRDGGVAVEVPRSLGRRAKVVRPGDEVDVGGFTPEAIGDFGGHLAEHVPSACRRYRATSGIALEP